MKVSVLIPLYNCEFFIEECLLSITNQTYRDIEILVSDDFSSDKSLDKASEIAQTDSRIHIFKQEKNIGLLKNYNFLFNKASGDLLCIQDSDDWSELDRIEKQVAIFEKYENIHLCGTSVTFHYPFVTKTINHENDLFLEQPMLDYRICPASVMFKRSVISTIGGFNEYFNGGTSMDRYFINEILSIHKGYYINLPLYHARIRKGSNHKTLSSKKITTHYLCEELIRQRIKTGTDWLKEREWEKIEEFENKILENNTILSEAYRSSAVLMIDLGDYADAYTLIIKSLKYKITKLNLLSSFYLLRNSILSLLRIIKKP